MYIGSGRWRLNRAPQLPRVRTKVLRGGSRSEKAWLTVLISDDRYGPGCNENEPHAIAQQLRIYHEKHARESRFRRVPLHIGTTIDRGLLLHAPPPRVNYHVTAACSRGSRNKRSADIARHDRAGRTNVHTRIVIPASYAPAVFRLRWSARTRFITPLNKHYVVLTPRIFALRPKRTLSLTFSLYYSRRE